MIQNVFCGFRIATCNCPSVREEAKSDHRIVEGHFLSPAQPHLKNLLPAESERAFFQMVLPRNDFLAGGKRSSSRVRRPMCIQARRHLTIGRKLTMLENLHLRPDF